MIDGLLASVAQMRNNAQDLRRRGRAESDPEKQAKLLAQAADGFMKSIAVLERGLRTARREQEKYSRDVCRVLEVLSQTYGSLGGTRRDARDLGQAQVCYDKGDEYEEERRRNCSAKDTYNMLQRLIVRLLLDPAELERAPFVAQLNDVRQEIERQVRDGRNDSWALADLAMVRFLCGSDAEVVIADLEKGQAEATFYESTYNVVLALLREGLGKGDPLGARLESFMLLLKRKGGFA